MTIAEGVMARTSAFPHASKLRRSLLVKASYFAVAPLIWLPIFWQGSCLIPPIYPVFLFLMFSFLKQVLSPSSNARVACIEVLKQQLSQTHHPFSARSAESFLFPFSLAMATQLT